MQRPLSYYAKAVRPKLPPHVFGAVPSRLAWLTLHVCLAAFGIWAVAHHVGGWWAAPLWSLLIGHAFAGCAFVGHETMHGAVIRNRTVRELVGWVCFLPFTLSPTLWDAWHNKVHHGNTGIDGVDPDSFPSRAQYDRSRATRVADHVAVGRHRVLGFITLILGFSGQCLQILTIWSKKTDALDAKDRRRVAIETALAFAFWGAVGWMIGGAAFLFAYVLPLLVGNLIVISYILTNHSLSPMNEINDPLYNSLSVEVPWIVNLLHLNFGLHVEHHLFPSMSSKYAPHVRDALVAQFPERYQSLPFLTAMKLLWQTPRVYADATTLVDPLSGYTASVILPREAGAQAEPTPTSPSPSPTSSDEPLPSAA